MLAPSRRDGLIGAHFDGWSLGASEIGRDTLPDDFHTGENFAIQPGGGALLVDRKVPVPEYEYGGTKGVWPFAVEGIYRIDIASGRIRRVNFDFRAVTTQRMAHFGGSPDGSRIAIIENWNANWRPWPDTAGMSPKEVFEAEREHHRHLRGGERTTLSVASSDGTPAQEIYTEPISADALATTGLRATSDEVLTPVQWSPDGSLLALEARTTEGRTELTAVKVFETTTWTQVASFADAHLLGTASWGPDCDRLLLGANIPGTGQPLSWIQHLDGTTNRLDLFPKPNSSGTRSLRPIGIADNNHLLTARVSGDTAAIMHTHIDTGEHKELLAWTRPNILRTAIAQMPPGTWE